MRGRPGLEIEDVPMRAILDRTFMTKLLSEIRYMTWPIKREVIEWKERGE